MCDRHTVLADASSPAANRAGLDASAPPPEWLVHLLALIIDFLRTHLSHYRLGLVPAWWYDRQDLPLGSAMQAAAAARGEFGSSIASQCRRRGIGPGHPDWPELSRAILAFGGSLRGFRPGQPAAGLFWWEAPEFVPGMIGMAAATPAAEAVGSLLVRQQAATTPPASPPVARAAPEPALLPAPRRVIPRAGPGPPTGPTPPLPPQICYA